MLTESEERQAREKLKEAMGMMPHDLSEKHLRALLDGRGIDARVWGKLLLHVQATAYLAMQADEKFQRMLQKCVLPVDFLAVYRERLEREIPLAAGVVAAKFTGNEALAIPADRKQIQ